jgi:DNA (cytosine-5)-methyltransferase 1
MFAGAGGLDLGFEEAGFDILEATDWNAEACATLRRNRPGWRVIETDAKLYVPSISKDVDCLIGGFPCQGFSLGGHREESDERNTLYKEMVRVIDLVQPRVVVMENVLNLRTMEDPETGKPFAEVIADAMRSIGYEVRYDTFRVSEFGTPQTRRRFVFIAVRGEFPKDFHFPVPDATLANAREWLWDLAHDEDIVLPNHEVVWKFNSEVHTATGEPVEAGAPILPVRFSRTASDGNPVRNWDKPFPAIDTGTVWGFAQGNVVAARVEKDRKSGKNVRNPDATVQLWRISASRLRTLTTRELARLQTFPDDWVFEGSASDAQMQIGNAVPVAFAARIAHMVEALLESLERGTSYRDPQLRVPSTLF